MKAIATALVAGRQTLAGRWTLLTYLLFLFIFYDNVCGKNGNDPYAKMSEHEANTHYPHRNSPDAPNAKKAIPILVKHDENGQPLVGMVGSRKDSNSSKGLKFPRGKQKTGEPISNALTREAAEETGFHAKDLTPVGKQIKGNDHVMQDGKIVAKKARAQVYHVSPNAQQMDHEDRSVRFVPYKEAKQQLKGNTGTSRILSRAHNNIHAGSPGARTGHQ